MNFTRLVKKEKLQFFMIFILIGISSIKVSAQLSSIYRQLHKGPYPVGFQSQWALDSSRPYALVPENDTILKMEARPILINIWYPAKKGKASKMEYSEYLNIETEEPYFEAFSEKLRAYNIKVIKREITEDETPESTKDLRIQQLLSLKVLAKQNLEPISEIKGLVVYHAGAGSSFEDNILLCEQLASHGYLVLGSAFQREDGASLNIDASTGSFKDFDFLINFALAQKKVSADTPLYLIGHSLGAQTIFRYIANGFGKKVRKAIFLDTTQDYHSLAFEFWSFVPVALRGLDHFTMKTLSVASPSAIFQLQDKLVQSDRTLLTIDSLGHNDFISQGILKLMFDKSPHRKEYFKRYVYLNNFIIDYLEGKDQMEKPWFNGNIEELPKNAAFNQTFNPTANIPPNARQLREFAKTEDIEKVIEVLTKFRKSHPESTIYSNTYGLAWVFELLSRNEAYEARQIHQFYSSFLGNSLDRSFKFYMKYTPNKEFVTKAEKWWSLLE